MPEKQATALHDAPSSSEKKAWQPVWIFSGVTVGITFVAYLYFVLTYGVDMPYWDDWQLLDLLRKIYYGQVGWWTILASKHNEHLMGAAFLIQAWQLLATGFNYKLQLVTGVVLQAAAFGILVTIAWPQIPVKRRPTWLAWSALIWFSWCQYQNLLWPFQTAWFLISFLLALTLTSLRRAIVASGPAWLGIAVAGALFASFASFQGTIVWFAGLVYLMGCAEFAPGAMLKSTILRRWVTATVCGLLLFAYVWQKVPTGDAPQGERFSFSNVVYVFLGIHGGFWGNAAPHALPGLGILMLVFTALALLKVYLSRQKSTYAIPASLITFGLCFVAAAAYGRSRFGIGPASDSHYTAYVIATYFGVFCILMRDDASDVKAHRLSWVTPVFYIVLLTATVSSFYSSLLRGLEWRNVNGVAVFTLLNYRTESDFVLAHTLFRNANMVRVDAQFLEAHQFGPFGDRYAVPQTVRAYLTIPAGMKTLLVRYPEHQRAILAAWDVYETGEDLREAFNPESDDFATDLITWCANAAKSTGAHYLSPHLAPFESDFIAIEESEAKKNPAGGSPK